MAARRALLGLTAATTAAAGVGYVTVALGVPEPPLVKAKWMTSALKSRREHIRALKGSGALQTKNGTGASFDILIIGGGATGAGAALDAATRGLRVALVEQEDFASGTSSRSTKLVHGGVRYLEKAAFQLDPGQMKLVFEALRERQVLLKNAPHLVWSLPIATPCYKAWEVPYYWAGMKAYDFVAAASGSNSLPMSKFLNAKESLVAFPNLKYTRDDEKTQSSLKGTIVYQDGQFDDARLAVALATTAAKAGAVVANGIRVEKFVFAEETSESSGSSGSGNPASGSGNPALDQKKPKQKRVVGVVVRDLEKRGSKPFTVHASAVLNCTGPFTDSVRAMGDKKRAPIMTPAGGTHVVLPSHFAPTDLGLIIPKTKDGRVVFVLPWLGGLLAGTTDVVAPITLTPKPTRDEVDFILEAVAPYLQSPATRKDVTSAWSGIRPLASAPKAGDGDGGKTENVSRDHVVHDENDGVVTVTGGKWTTYRLMAEHAVDAAIAVAAEVDQTITTRTTNCVTPKVPVTGAHGYGPDLVGKLLMENARVSTLPGGRRAAFSTNASSVSLLFSDQSVIEHLVCAYGDRAQVVLQLAKDHENLAKRLVPNHPVLAAEVAYAAREEYCLTTRDFLARRSRLAFLDVDAAEAAAPVANALLAKELGWGWFKQRRELRATMAFLRTFRCDDA